MFIFLMELQTVIKYNMKAITNIIILLMITSSFSQKDKNYFKLYKDGKNYKKKNVYVLFQKGKDQKKIIDDKIYFKIKGENFYLKKGENRIDTCTVRSLKKIKLSDVSSLEKKEYAFFKKTLEKDNKLHNSNIKLPMPITKLHLFLNIMLIEKKENKIIKYYVNWTYTSSRGMYAD